jgi:hypothetical protein
VCVTASLTWHHHFLTQRLLLLCRHRPSLYRTVQKKLLPPDVWKAVLVVSDPVLHSVWDLSSLASARSHSMFHIISRWAFPYPDMLQCLPSSHSASLSFGPASKPNTWPSQNLVPIGGASAVLLVLCGFPLYQIRAVEIYAVPNIGAFSNRDRSPFG